MTQEEIEQWLTKSLNLPKNETIKINEHIDQPLKYVKEQDNKATYHLNPSLIAKTPHTIKQLITTQKFHQALESHLKNLAIKNITAKELMYHIEITLEPEVAQKTKRQARLEIEPEETYRPIKAKFRNDLTPDQMQTAITNETGKVLLLLLAPQIENPESALSKSLKKVKQATQTYIKAQQPQNLRPTQTHPEAPVDPRSASVQPMIVPTVPVGQLNTPTIPSTDTTTGNQTPPAQQQQKPSPAQTHQQATTLAALQKLAKPPIADEETRGINNPYHTLNLLLINQQPLAPENKQTGEAQQNFLSVFASLRELITKTLGEITNPTQTLLTGIKTFRTPNPPKQSRPRRRRNGYRPNNRTKNK